MQLAERIEDFNTKSRTKKLEPYIMKKCDVEMSDWNDGICGGYLVGQEDDFVFYVLLKKTGILVGALAKKYITQVTVIQEKDGPVVNIEDFASINNDYFLNKNVNINLNEKHIWDGIFGEDKEYGNAKVVSINEKEITLEIAKEIFSKVIPLEEVVKLEVLLS